MTAVLLIFEVLFKDLENESYFNRQVYQVYRLSGCVAVSAIQSTGDRIFS